MSVSRSPSPRQSHSHRRETHTLSATAAAASVALPVGKAVRRREGGNGPHRCMQCKRYIRRYLRFMLCGHTLCRDCGVQAHRTMRRCPRCPLNVIPLLLEHMHDDGRIIITESGRGFLSREEMLKIRSVEDVARDNMPATRPPYLVPADASKNMPFDLPQPMQQPPMQHQWQTTTPLLDPYDSMLPMYARYGVQNAIPLFIY